jgi:pimeloyl-ACP methyl ester carboxylesterase
MSLPGRHVDVGGTRIYYHRSGRGQPVVLLHGYLVSHWQWRHVIPRLALEHDVIALDLPGFGESDRPPPTAFPYDPRGFADTVVAVLDRLGIAHASLMGHSMGGGVALYVAARRPERVTRLVLVDPLVYRYRVPLEGKLLRIPGVGSLLFKTAFSRSLVARYMRDRVYRDPALVTPDWVDYVWQRANRPGGLAAAHATLRFATDPEIIAGSVRAVRAPTLVVWGADDRLFPSRWAERLAGEIAGAKAIVTPVCGHSPPEERPEEFLRSIVPFLHGRKVFAEHKRALG